MTKLHKQWLEFIGFVAIFALATWLIGSMFAPCHNGTESGCQDPGVGQKAELFN